MQEHRISVPELALVAVTRGIAGIGAGLLLSQRIKSKRVMVGWTMLALGALSTIPLVLRVFRKRGERVADTGLAHPGAMKVDSAPEEADLLTH